MFTRVLLVAFLLLLYSCEMAEARKWRFLPGDAFFRTEITEELVAQLKATPEDGDILLQYSWGAHIQETEHDNGYKFIKLVGLTRTRKAMIVSMYSRLRKLEPLQLEVTRKEGSDGEQQREINGIPMFIYNSDFNATRFRVGLRYNEEWPHQEHEFGIPREWVNYPATDAGLYVFEDWQNSKHVAKLAAVLPADVNGTRATASPVSKEARDSAIIVTLEPNLEDLMNRRDGGGMLFYTLMEDGIQLVSKGDEWRSRALSR